MIDFVGNAPLSAMAGEDTVRYEPLLLPPAYTPGYFCYRGAYRAMQKGQCKKVSGTFNIVKGS